MDISIDTLTRYFIQKGTVILLESQSSEHRWSRKTYLAASPKATIKAWENQVVITEQGTTHETKQNPWNALTQFRNRHEGWLFGYLGYDLKNHIEKLHSKNKDPIGAPDLFFMVPRILIEFDRETGQYSCLKGEMPPENEVHSSKVEDNSFVSIKNFKSRTSKQNYIKKIEEAQERIAEGDFYEVNLSHQMKGKFSGKPFSLYKSMRKIGPVPFGAFIKTKSCTVCCQSPERFLRKEERRVFSQPIKGTARRSTDISEDRQLRQQLIQSPKEQAENLMIVDLVRNDLSKIARQGSVNVPKLFEIETFGTVHQMVSTVEAEAEKENPIAILKACFPMGSMTGAPKISAMKTIEELEDYRRGIYSGAIGYIQPNGDFDFNVVIRTAILKNKDLFYAVGGAITGDSDPLAEWDETLVKAQAITEAFSKS